MRYRTSSVKVGEASDLPHQGINVLLDVWSVSRATSGLLNGALAPSGLTADEFAVYSLLARQGPLTPTQLAVQMATPPTTTSSYISRFQRRGHVRRDPHPSDGRSYRVELTPAGRRAHRRAADLFRPVLRDVVDALGEEEPVVRSALGHLRKTLDQVREGSGTDEAMAADRGETELEASR